MISFAVSKSSLPAATSSDDNKSQSLIGQKRSAPAASTMSSSVSSSSSSSSGMVCISLNKPATKRPRVNQPTTTTINSGIEIIASTALLSTTSSTSTSSTLPTTQPHQKFSQDYTNLTNLIKKILMPNKNMPSTQLPKRTITTLLQEVNVLNSQQLSLYPYQHKDVMLSIVQLYKNIAQEMPTLNSNKLSKWRVVDMKHFLHLIQSPRSGTKTKLIANIKQAFHSNSNAANRTKSFLIQKMNETMATKSQTGSYLSSFVQIIEYNDPIWKKFNVWLDKKDCWTSKHDGLIRSDTVLCDSCHIKWCHNSLKKKLRVKDSNVCLGCALMKNFNLELLHVIPSKQITSARSSFSIPPSFQKVVSTRPTGINIKYNSKYTPKDGVPHIFCVRYLNASQNRTATNTEDESAWDVRLNNYPFASKKLTNGSMAIKTMTHALPYSPNTLSIISESFIYGSQLVTQVHPPPLHIIVAQRISVQELMKKVDTLNIDVAKQRCVDWFLKGVESGIDMPSAKISFRCPLSMGRMKNPARGKSCQHQSCFEASMYIQFNRNNSSKNAWKCPLCQEMVSPNELIVDLFVKHMIESVHKDVLEIEVYKDGTFSSASSSTSSTSSSSTSSSFTSSSSSSSSSSILSSSNAADSNAADSTAKKSNTVQDNTICLSSDEEDDDDGSVLLARKKKQIEQGKKDQGLLQPTSKQGSGVNANAAMMDVVNASYSLMEQSFLEGVTMFDGDSEDDSDFNADGMYGDDSEDDDSGGDLYNNIQQMISPHDNLQNVSGTGSADDPISL